MNNRCLQSLHRKNAYTYKIIDFYTVLHLLSYPAQYLVSMSVEEWVDENEGGKEQGAAVDGHGGPAQVDLLLL